MIIESQTIRPDRDRYYVGADELFSRHSDIVNYMCWEAVVHKFMLGGLVWLSRLTEKGMRRVKIYFKHLVFDEPAHFHSAMGAPTTQPNKPTTQTNKVPCGAASLPSVPDREGLAPRHPLHLHLQSGL